MKTIAIKHDNEIQIDTFDDDKETEVKEFYKGKIYKIVPNRPDGIYELDFNNGVWVNVEESYKLENYAELRANEYPSIQEQLDMQYWDKINNTTVWEDTIAAIKAKYPKE